jgi:CHAT domain/SIR2-like domain
MVSRPFRAFHPLTGRTLRVTFRPSSDTSTRRAARSGLAKTTVLTRTFRFTLTSTGDGYAVRLASDGALPPVTAPFYFDLNPASRLNQVVKAIGDASVTYDNLREVGAILFTALLYGDVRDRFLLERQELEQSAGHDPVQFVLRLDLPAELRHLPWECLYEEARGFGFLLNDPRYVLVRDTPAVETREIAARQSLPLRMLVVIPQGSQLNVDKELHGLDLAVSRLGDAIEYAVLQGEVTPDRLNDRINSERWDVVHFIGHGDVVDDTVRVRLNSEDPENPDQWVDGEVFSTFFRRSVPRLIVLNCCYGGSQASLRTFSGLGPYLVRAGVPAIVAMQYEIPDTVAIKFAEKFYGELLSGSDPGRIDFALTAARLSLYQNQSKDRPQSFITPVLYLVPGREALLELAGRQAPAIVKRVGSEPSPAAPRPELPQDLLDAFKERRIVPVVGPELLAVGAMRSKNPPGPRQLAELLAREAQFPRMDLFERSDADAESSGVWLLAAVCQHYERKKERWKLLTAVQRAYKDFPPPPAICQIASWDVPGVICAYFDGLMTEALTGAHKTFRALQSVDQKAAGYRDETLVVHVRGVYSESDSLVLTERDQELLLDRMMSLSSHVADLARKTVGRSLLYLGVSPRDLLIRRLTRALRGNGRNQGPMFFVRPDQSVEDAYWDDYNVQWLPMTLDAFLEAVADSVQETRT